MVALKHERSSGHLPVLIQRGAGGAVQLDVFLHELAVVSHPLEPRVGRLPARGVESRRGELDIKSLPLAGRKAGVDSRRVAFDVHTGRVSGEYRHVITGLPEGGNHWSRTVRVGPDGAELGRLEVPFQQRETKVEARIVDLGGAAALVAVGAHLERVDVEQPFDPDVAPFEPHGALVYFVEL